MPGTRTTGDPRRPHDRLCTLYGRAYEALEQLEAEVETLIETGEMNGPTADLAASGWAARFDELKGMAGDLATRIDGWVVEVEGPPDAAGAAAPTAGEGPGPADAGQGVPPGEASGGPGYRKDSGGWRERLRRARQSPDR